VRRILSVHSHASSSAQLYFCFNLKPRGVETLNDNRTATGSTMLTNMRAQFSSPAQYPFGVHCATGIRIITVYSPRNFKRNCRLCAPISSPALAAKEFGLVHPPIQHVCRIRTRAAFALVAGNTLHLRCTRQLRHNVHRSHFGQGLGSQKLLALQLRLHPRAPVEGVGVVRAHGQTGVE